MSNTSDFKVKNGLSVGTSITAVGSLTTAGQTFPAADGSTGQYLKTDGSGALSWGTVSTSFNITDGTTTDTVGLTETVTFTGGTNITLAVTDNTVTINNDHVNSSDITENTNLFFTDARAIAAVQAAADLTIDGGTIYVDTSANRVGISDTSPQQTLDVAGNIGVNGTEVINASSQIVGAVLDSALTVGGSLAGVLSNLKVQYGTAYSGTPIQGSFFFDSLNQKLKVYTGSAFVDAVPAGSGGGGGGGATDANTTFRNYSYTLTGTTSAVTGADDNEITAGAFIVGHKYTITATGNTNFVTIGAANSNVGTVFTATGVGTGTGTAKQTLFYDTTSSATRVVAYVNGIKQVYGSGRDFVATTGTSVAFTYNLGSGDTVDLQVYELLTNAAYYLKTETLATTAVNSNIATAVADYLPLAGGTLTGQLNHISAGGGDYIAKFQNTTSGTPYGVHIKDASSGSTGYPLLNISNHGGNATHFRVDSGAGRVGFGASPSSTSQVTIQGPAGTSGSEISTKALHIIEGGYNNGATFQVSNASSVARFVVDGSGKVGIGTDSPGTTLDIRGSVNLRKTNGLLFFTNDSIAGSTNVNASFIGMAHSAGYHVTSNDGGFASNANSLLIGNYNSGGGDIILATSNAGPYASGRVIIKESGNVGIGTSSPGEKLSVNGTVSGSSYRILSGSTISYSGSVGRNTKIKGPTGTDVGISLFNSANTFAMQLYGDGNNSYGFLNGDWAGWDLKKTVAASGGNLYMNNSVDYWLNANGTSKTYQHLVGGVSNTAGGAVFKVGSSSNNGELSLNSVNAGSDIVSYNRSNGTYHPLNYYAGSHNTFIAGNTVWSVDANGHIKTQHGNTGGYAQTSGSGGIAIVNDQGSIGCSLISVTNAARGWSNFYVNRIHTTGQDTRFMQFSVNGSGATGYIRLASASTMTYGTSSDYRLKENVVYDWDATTRLKQLKPARFNFILDGDDVVQDGFMAHEVSDIVPLAVQGTKDAMKEEDYEVTPAVYDSEGNETEAAVMGTRTAIDPQGIDHSMLVPLLVKTIQELEARLTAAGI